MQAAKDSFYMSLRARLAALNPSRTTTIDGATIPGILVRENMEPRFTEAQAGVFYVDYGLRHLVCERRNHGRLGRGPGTNAGGDG
jgi:hypothetical protein